jgi:hypothetical protein
LLFVPRERFQQDNQSEPRTERISNDLPDMPHHDGMATRKLRSQQDGISLDWSAQVGSLRLVPHQQQVRRDSDGLLFVPRQRFQQDGKPEPRAERISNGLPDLPHHNSLATREF